MSSRYHPCLPKTLISELLSDPRTACSAIFTQEFDDIRYRICQRYVVKPESIEVKFETPSDPLRNPFNLPSLCTNDIMDNIRRSFAGDQKTWLHHAVRSCDLLLAHEILRLGIDVDAKDKDGVTSLFFAMELLLWLKKFDQLCSTKLQGNFRPEVVHMCKKGLETTWTKIDTVSRIATLIIGQHADVDAGAFGLSPLSLAVEAQAWNLVELLLVHGARRPNSEQLKFTSPEDEARMADILRNTQASRSRLPRPCPCWSGKLLSECHNSVGCHPYPAHFPCDCGKYRTYGTCCGKRGVPLCERWCPELKRIMMCQHESEAGPIFQNMNDAGNYMVGMQFLLRSSSSPTSTRDTDLRRITTISLSHSGRESELDPAFLFAFKNTTIYPKPWTKQYSKLESQSRMDVWNKAVDRYIATGQDTRPCLEIQIQSKLDMNGGPLYKTCEAEGCRIVEGRDQDKLQCCGGCKLIFYCGRRCQALGWKDHKKKCGAGTHELQKLPSQIRMEDIVTAAVKEIGADMRKTARS